MPVSEASNGKKVWQLRDRNQTLIRYFGYLVTVAVFMWCWKQISDSTTWYF